MVFALETFWPSNDGWSAARIEEQLVVTKDGCEVITRFPAEELLVTAGGQYTVAGPLPGMREKRVEPQQPALADAVVDSARSRERMPADVIMPMLGMAQETGKVLRWLKEDGEAVAQGRAAARGRDRQGDGRDRGARRRHARGRARAEGDGRPVGEVIALVLAEGEAAPRAGCRRRAAVVREVEAVAAAPA